MALHSITIINTDYYNIDEDKILNTLCKTSGSKWHLFVRLHPNVSKLTKKLKIKNFINVSEYPDLQELIIASDILISDYSSLMFDFSYLKKTDIRDFYVYNLSSLKWTHQSVITAVKWFPPGYSYKKKGQMQFSPDEHESSIVVSLGEDGIVMIWDYKSLNLQESKSAQIINDVNDYLIPKKIEVNKVDSIGRISGTGLEIEDVGNQKFYFYISTDEEA